jgi:hypothetical protein
VWGGICKFQIFPCPGYGVLLEDSMYVAKSKPLTFNMTRKESVALKSLEDSKEILILQADRGNCTVVLNESTYTRRYLVYRDLGFMKFYVRIPVLKLRARYGNCSSSRKLSFRLP